ncbi:MAG: hypothetical protein QW379_09920 [Thermoplasmata archaeon]
MRAPDLTRRRAAPEPKRLNASPGAGGAPERIAGGDGGGVIPPPRARLRGLGGAG